jgi:hypothetical protein
MLRRWGNAIIVCTIGDSKDKSASKSCKVFPCLLVSVFTLPPDQLLFTFPPHFFDRDLALHRCLSIWLFFHIHQLYRQTHLRIFCPATFIVGRNAALRVGGPTGVIGPVCTFDNVAITRHKLTIYRTSQRFP